MNFRDDINALRCIAVISVVLYHFNIAGFGGGFSGVDVFFVISGFLMTSILIPLRSETNIPAALGNFYLRRIRRIFPALVILCLCLLLFGYFWLPPMDYAAMGSHVAASISYISNFIYKGEEGYFDGPSQDNWLLHTWSLSLEWQFYLLYPFLLLGLNKIDKNKNGKAIVIGISVIALLSYALSAWLSPIKMAFSFYILPTRFWEFLAGGLIYFLPQWRAMPKWASCTLEITGLALICLTVFVCNRDMQWPGYAAILPVLGTSMVIAANRPHAFWMRLPPVQKIGLWSYSIYLWHWPILRAIRYFNLDMDARWLTLGLALSIAAGALSFYVVEQPVRLKSANWPLFHNIALVAGTVIILCGAGMGIYLDNGIPSRVPSLAAFVPPIEHHGGGGGTYCHFDKHSKILKDCLSAAKNKSPAFIIWGDSHAGVIAGAIGDISKKHGLLYTESACPTIFNAYPRMKGYNSGCSQFNAQVFKEISTLPSSVPVIIANRWSFYTLGSDEDIKRLTGMAYLDGDTQGTQFQTFTRHLTATLCAVARQRKTYVVLPIPEMPKDVPKTLARELMVRGVASDMFITRENYDKRQAETLVALHHARKICGVALLDPAPYFCSDGKCYGSRNTVPLYKDDNHLNAAGQKIISPLFEGIPALAVSRNPR